MFFAVLRVYRPESENILFPFIAVDQQRACLHSITFPAAGAADLQPDISLLQTLADLINGGIEVS
ncbi:hypothetical protein D3C75_1144010 [compost metagenome]